jgi:peptide chain release factor 3
LDEIERSLALDVTPASWPIGMGRNFLGTYDLFADALLLFERDVHDRVTEPVRCKGLDDPKLPRLLPKVALAKSREEVETAKELCPPFTRKPIAKATYAGLFRRRAEQFRAMWARHAPLSYLRLRILTIFGRPAGVEAISLV